MRPFRPLVLAAVAATSVGLALPATAAPSTPKAVDGLSARTVAQIDALAQAKRGLTATQKKVDSRLLTEAKQRARPVRRRRRRPRRHRRQHRQGRHDRGRRARQSQGRHTGRAGCRRPGLAASVAGNAVRASVPLTAVESLAGKAGVQHVDVAAQAMLANEGGRVAPASKAELTKRISGALAQAKAAPAAAVPAATAAVVSQGSMVTEGDTAARRRQARARSRYRHRRQGRRALRRRRLAGGVDRVRRPAARRASAARPGGRRRRGHRDARDRPRPRAERAPVFATAFTSGRASRTTSAPCARPARDIIVDDVIYFAESPFQDGPIAQAVIDVTNDGALYFSSAGNEQNVDDRTAGNWEGDYVASGQSIGKFAGVAHDFDPGPGVQVLDPVVRARAGVPTILQWNDPLGAFANDYDLYASTPTATCVAFSHDVQDGDDDPFEGFNLPTARSASPW